MKWCIGELDKIKMNENYSQSFISFQKTRLDPQVAPLGLIVTLIPSLQTGRPDGASLIQFE